MVGLLVGLSVGHAFVSPGRDEPANDLFRVNKVVFITIANILIKKINGWLKIKKKKGLLN